MEQPGYIRSLPWETTYNSFLHPRSIRFMLALAGIAAPPARRYCELAFGMGVSLVLHAACNPDIEWTGTDFNPEHVAFAARLRALAGLTDLELHDVPIAAYCGRPPVLPYDVIACTGTWSWLPPIDQSAIAQFAGRHLASHGALAIDHMTMPGQSATTSLRQLLVTLAAQIPEPRPADWPRLAVEKALAFCQLQPRFAHHRDHAVSLLESLRKSTSSALVHEYFNAHWRPRHLAATDADFSVQGLAWAASLIAGQAVDALHLTPRQAQAMADIEDRLAREQLKDLIVDRGMRGDIWMRAPALGRPDCDRDVIGDMPVVLVVPPDEVPISTHGSLGRVLLAPAVYGPVVAVLGDHRPLRIADLHERTRHVVEWTDLVEAVTVLLDRNCVQLSNPDPDAIARAGRTSRAFNVGVASLPEEAPAVHHLGSPVTGQGIQVSRLDRLLIRAELEGAATIEESRRRVEAWDTQLTVEQIDAGVAAYAGKRRPLYAALGLVGDGVGGAGEALR